MKGRQPAPFLFAAFHVEAGSPVCAIDCDSAQYRRRSSPTYRLVQQCHTGTPIKRRFTARGLRNTITNGDYDHEHRQTPLSRKREHSGPCRPCHNLAVGCRCGRRVYGAHLWRCRRGESAVSSYASCDFLEHLFHFMPPPCRTTPCLPSTRRGVSFCRRRL